MPPITIVTDCEPFANAVNTYEDRVGNNPNYADAWRHLKRYQLETLSSEEWGDLVEKLMHLHARAYQWQPPEARARQEMAGRLAEMRGQETRFRLKALVDQLDLVHQEQVL